MVGTVTYHQQVSYCGKPRCRKCRDGTGHGPYWYAYRTEQGRTIRTYIGKQLPPDVQATQVTQAIQTTPIAPTPTTREQLSPELDSVVIRLLVLGQFRLERRSEETWQPIADSAWQHQQVRALLGCLVSSPGRKLGREQVIDALWPELDLETGTDRLHRAVYSLRRILEPTLSRPAASQLLRTERDLLILADQTLVWVDADAFESLLARATASSDSSETERLLEQAATLYGGNFLPEERQLKWTVTRRQGLQRSWIGLLLKLADLRIAKKALSEAIELLDRLLAIDAANEAAVQRLIAVLAQLERRGEALRAYQRFATVLQRNYDIAPLPETRKLYEAVRQGETPVITSTSTPTTPASIAEPVEAPINVPGPAVPIGRSHQGLLVGRDPELEILRNLLTKTENERSSRPSGWKKPTTQSPETPPHSQCILLFGEPGIGKTRLAEEMGREAQQRGWAVAWSRVYAQESNVPYRLWTEVLRSTMAQGLWQKQEVSKRPVTYAPLCALLPELSELIPPVVYSSPVSPEQEQLRLRETTLQLLSRISEHTALLIVLDDLQWADGSSCELLGYLARRLTGTSIVLAGTCRETEIPPRHSFRPLLTDLRREQAALTLSIQPLTDEQISTLVAPLPEPTVQQIQSLAAGNPFFAEELARNATVPAPAPDSSPDRYTPLTLPGTITAVLDLRMGRLSSACQRLLSKASIWGGSFEFQMIRSLEAGSGGHNKSGPTADEDTILDLLEEALSAGMLVEEGSGTRISYSFWHPLIVTHLYDGLSAARRASLHRRAADILRQAYTTREEEGAATITHHLVQGGAEPLLIAHYAERAGDHAYALSAYPEAERYYRLAFTQREEANRQSPTTMEGDELQLMAYLLERLGECAVILGNFEEARTLYERVLEIRSSLRAAGSLTDIKQEAQIDALLWCEVGRTWRYTGNDARAQQCYERGEQVLSEAEVVGGTAWASLRLQQSYMWWREGNYDEARRMGNEALKLFEEVLQREKLPAMDYSRLTRTRLTLAGDPIDLGRTHALLGPIAASIGQPVDAVVHLNTALTVFEKYDNKRAIAHVCSNLGYVLLRKAEYTQAQAFFRRSLHLAERIGDVPLLAVVFSSLGELAVRIGDLREAESRFSRSLTLAEHFNFQVYMSEWNTCLALVLQEQGKIAEAKTSIHNALSIGRAINNTPCIGLALIALGNLRLAQALNWPWHTSSCCKVN